MKKGFSLVELCIALIIIGVLIAGAIGVSRLICSQNNTDRPISCSSRSDNIKEPDNSESVYKY